MNPHESSPPPDYETATQGSPSPPAAAINRRLGLINGRYEIDCSELQHEWTEYQDYEFSLILTLEGTELWGAFDFGMYSGIMYLQRRPFVASGEDRLEFSWRGEEHSEGEIYFGSGNHGWLMFLGDGIIGGEINCYGTVRFQGRRLDGLGTRSELDARSMKAEWDGYHQAESERRYRSKWGMSQW